MKLELLERRKARVEMVPLIDTIFLLLLFFIYAMLSMRVHHALPVRLPASSSAEIDQAGLVQVTLQADGAIFVDHRLVPLDQLADLVKQQHPTPSDEVMVMVFADRRVAYQSLFQVLDQIRGAGIRRIALQAEPAPSP